MDPAAGPLARIDWRQPWFAPWRDLGENVAAGVLADSELHEALNQQPQAPLRFVGQQALPPGQAYEHFISSNGQCPVRAGLHDFFNGVVWLGMPLAKARLNQLQAAQIEERGVGAVRGPVRDAITVFDENGALLDAPPALWEALLERDWRRLFVDLRPLWSEARLLVVGHAMLEKLVAPRKALTAHVWRSPVGLASRVAADAQLAAMLTPAALEAKPFTSLPLLGIPGWSAANGEVCFYDDAQVFRPRRAPERQTTPPLPARAQP
jgi:hypothetical protein